MGIAVLWFGIALAGLCATCGAIAACIYRRGFSQGQADARYRLESRERDMRDRHAGEIAALKQEFRDKLESLGRLVETEISIISPE